MAGEAILIVDDNAANLKLMRVLMTGEGYAVWTAVDADTALDVLKQHKPQVILMDIQLPGMNGLELTRRIKADPETRDIAIVAVTAYAMTTDEQKAREAGCDAYISKPIDTRSLPSIVRGLIRPQ
jgi:CheY-like chemotaxis protein